jgi:hypothetical protein
MSVSINGSAGLTFNDGSTQNTSPFTGGFAMRNRIINGDMRIDQRNAGAAINNAPDGTWAVDRWVRYQNVGASNVGRNLNGITPPAGFTNYLGIQISTAGTATSGQYTNFQHYIEGFNSADLAWGTANAQAATISFWVHSSLTGTQGFALQNASSALGYPFTVTINAANTWEYKTVTIPGPTTGTWDTTNGRGITLIADLGMGSSFRFTAGSWQSGNVQGVTGANSLNQTLNATFYITGWQLEKGSTATSFDVRPYAIEEELCQRYLPAWAGSGVYGMGIAANTDDSYIILSLPAPTRVAPTGIYASSGSGFVVSDITSSFSTTSAMSFSQASVYTLTIKAVASPQVSNRPVTIQGNSTSSLIYGTGCEL